MRNLILLFGEDDNDTRSLAILCRAFAPKGVNVATRVIKKPPVLSANAALKKKQAMSNTMAKFAREQEKIYDRVVVVAHRDCDECEPAHEKNSKELHDELSAGGVKFPVPATPAWEMETWWMTFPAELQMTRGCWRKVNYDSLYVGKIENSKERLIKDLRPINPPERAKCREYIESDSITIAEKVVANNKNLNEAVLKAASLDDFRTRLQAALI